MAFHATVLKVLIASPGDTIDFRNAAERALHAWNGSRAETSGFVLLPLRWETDAVSTLDGTDGQSVINTQLVDQSDIVIALFHIRLGRATPRAVSGTVEELTRAMNSGKRVHLYFSNSDLPRDFDSTEYDQLKLFKKDAEKLGLYGSFDNPHHLEDQIKGAIELDLRELVAQNIVNAPTTAASMVAHARLLVNYIHAGRNETLRVTNVGEATAADITLTLTSTDEDQRAPFTWGDEKPFTLPPGGHFDIRTQTYAGTALHIVARLEWLEDGEHQDSEQSVSLL